MLEVIAIVGTGKLPLIILAVAQNDNSVIVIVVVFSLASDQISTIHPVLHIEGIGAGGFAFGEDGLKFAELSGCRKPTKNKERMKTIRDLFIFIFYSSEYLSRFTIV